MVVDGCAYGMINREKIEETQRMVHNINTKIDKVDEKITELFNHQSNRWPPTAAWSLGIVGTILGGVVTSFVFKLLGAI